MLKVKNSQVAKLNSRDSLLLEGMLKNGIINVYCAPII